MIFVSDLAAISRLFSCQARKVIDLLAAQASVDLLHSLEMRRSASKHPLSVALETNTAASWRYGYLRTPSPPFCQGAWAPDKQKFPVRHPRTSGLRIKPNVKLIAHA